MAAPHYVLLGDVVDSQKIDDRSAFQQQLRDGLATVNDAYGTSIHTEFRILKGIDEVGGVLTDPAATYDIVKTLAETVHPYEITTVLVYDEIDVGLDQPNVAQMDGPAFAHADERIQENKRRDFLFDVAVGGGAIESLLRDMVNLLLFFRGTWTDRQREIARAYETADTQKAVAAELDVSEGLVSRQLSTARAKQVLEMEKRVSDAFGELEPPDSPAENL